MSSDAEDHVDGWGQWRCFRRCKLDALVLQVSAVQTQAGFGLF